MWAAPPGAPPGQRRRGGHHLSGCGGHNTQVASSTGAGGRPTGPYQGGAEQQARGGQQHVEERQEARQQRHAAVQLGRREVHPGARPRVRPRAVIPSASLSVRAVLFNTVTQSLPSCRASPKRPEGRSAPTGSRCGGRTASTSRCRTRRSTCACTRPAAGSARPSSPPHLTQLEHLHGVQGRSLAPPYAPGSVSL